MEWRGIDKYRALILHGREAQNINNITRTEYYKFFWEKHPEVPWALLAHLVSRNAGYQMSDLARFTKVGAPLQGTLYPDFQGIAMETVIPALFSMLEAGNFLILRDVLPALEVYRFAKLFPDHSSELFDLLKDPVFDADPFIVSHWETFFDRARSANWATDWSNDWSAGTDIQTHSFALVANEQNQIEDRLVNDPSKRYWAKFFPYDLMDLVRFTGQLGLTRLCVPLSTSTSNPTPDTILVYAVSDFTLLDKRIHTGRNLFTGLFQDTNRSKLLQAWVLQQKTFTGSRTDYNKQDYDIDRVSIIITGDVYSPPLGYVTPKAMFDKFTPAWPYNPGRSPRFSHIHRTPALLPKKLSVTATPTKIAEWLAPLSTPTQLFIVCAPSQLCEIFI